MFHLLDSDVSIGQGVGMWKRNTLKNVGWGGRISVEFQAPFN